MKGFPKQDPHWVSVANFVESHLQGNEALIAPHPFTDRLKNVVPYSAKVRSMDSFNWVIIHKGSLEKINSELLSLVKSTFHPVFANEVFVVFSNRSELSKEAITSPHVQALFDQMEGNNSREKSRKVTGVLQSRIASFTSRFKESNAEIRKEVDVLSEQMHMNHQEMMDNFRLVLERSDYLESRVSLLSQEVAVLRNSLEKRDKSRHQSIASMSRTELQDISRSACQTTYLGDGVLLCRVLGRYLLYGEANDIGIVPHLSMSGFWEPWITLAIARIVQPGWRCIDVGANHGYYSLLIAELVGASGQVLALEPNPKLAGMVDQTLEINGFRDRSSVVQKAVSDQAIGKINLVIPKTRGMNASICRPITELDNVVEVETVTLNELTQNWSNVDFIKVDAEGAEELIWKGMLDTIRKNPRITIVLEFNCSRYPAPKVFLEEILKEGFLLQHIDFDAEIKPLTVERCLAERPNEDWMLFLRQEA